MAILLSSILLGLAVQSFAFPDIQCSRKAGIRYRSCANVKGFTEIGGSCYAPIAVSGDLEMARTACKRLHPEADLATPRCEIENHLMTNLAQRTIGQQCLNASKDAYLNQAWIELSSRFDLSYRNLVRQQPPPSYYWFSSEESMSTTEKPEEKQFDSFGLIINEKTNKDIGMWKPMDPSSRMCGAICEVLVETSGNSCEMNACGEPLDQCQYGSTDKCVKKIEPKQEDEICSVQSIEYQTCDEVPGFVDVGGSCYAAIYAEAGYDSARAICKKLHPKADLASIRCEAENSMIVGMSHMYLHDRCVRYSTSFIYLDAAWIGLNHVGPNMTATWPNGVQSNYRKWNYGEPNNGIGARPEPVASIEVAGSWSQGRWNDMHPNDKMCGAICEVLVRSSGKSCEMNPCGRSNHPLLY